jgi:hypothetical protein
MKTLLTTLLLISGLIAYGQQTFPPNGAGNASSNNKFNGMVQAVISIKTGTDTTRAAALWNLFPSPELLDTGTIVVQDGYLFYYDGAHWISPNIGGGSQTLDQTLFNGNTSTTPIILSIGSGNTAYQANLSGDGGGLFFVNGSNTLYGDDHNIFFRNTSTGDIIGIGAKGEGFFFQDMSNNMCSFLPPYVMGNYNWRPQAYSYILADSLAVVDSDLAIRADIPYIVSAQWPDFFADNNADTGTLMGIQDPYGNQSFVFQCYNQRTPFFQVLFGGTYHTVTWSGGNGITSTTKFPSIGGVLADSIQVIDTANSLKAAINKCAQTIYSGRESGVTGNSTYSINSTIAGEYLIAPVANLTAVTGGTLTVTITYIDETSNSQTLTFYPQGQTTAAFSAQKPVPYAPMSLYIPASTLMTITYTITGTVTYNSGLLVQLN